MPREVPTDPDILELLLAGQGGDGSRVDKDRIVEAVEALPRAHRELINALFWEGVSLREYASRKRLHRRQAENLRDEAHYRLWKALR